MVSWIAPASGSPTGYAYQYKKVNDASWSTETQVTATFVTLSGLASNTAYTFRVRAVYDGSYSNYAYIDFTTDCAIQSLPYTEGFENGIGCWQLLVNKEDNAITGIDTKAKHTGSYGFKFVPDAPSPQYLISPEFDGSTAVKLAFYYKNASTDNAETFQAGYSTTGSDPADFTWEEEVTATNAEWTQYKTEFPEGTKYVAVKYTSEGKTNIYLDDFTFEQAAILVKTLWPADNSAYISWTGNNDSYQMKYRQAAFIPGQFTLFTENFEGDSWTSNWTRSSDGTRKTESDGTHFYRFSTYSLKAKTKYLLSRQLSGYTGGATLRLYYRAPQTAAASLMGESFYVGYSTTDSNVSSFVWGASISAPIDNTNWQLYEMTLPADVKYVSIKTSANILGKNIDFDNITITNDKTVYPWSSVSATESSVMLTGLTPATEYEYQILGLDGSEVATSTLPATFTTLAAGEKATIVLDDAASNSPVIEDFNGVATNVMLNGRTLWKDGYWNTLCLPFGMTAAQVTAQLAPTELKELDATGTYDGHQTGLDGSTLYLVFKDATTISAGVPYLIKWTGDGTNNIVNPVFTGVTINNASLTDNAVTFTGGKFIGTYDYTEYRETNKYILFMGDTNTLHYPQPDLTNPDNPIYPYVGACRAYFELDNSIGNAVLYFGNETTGIRSLTPDPSPKGEGSGWYTLQGLKLGDSKPTAPGVYIHNGKKIVIK